MLCRVHFPAIEPSRHGLSICSVASAGALLLVLGVDIIHEWLINTHHRVGRAEFALSWLCFSCTMVLTSLMPISVRIVALVPASMA